VQPALKLQRSSSPLLPVDEGVMEFWIAGGLEGFHVTNSNTPLLHYSITPDAGDEGVVELWIDGGWSATGAETPALQFSIAPTVDEGVMEFWIAGGPSYEQHSTVVVLSGRTSSQRLMCHSESGGRSAARLLTGSRTKILWLSDLYQIDQKCQARGPEILRSFGEYLMAGPTGGARTPSG